MPSWIRPNRARRSQRGAGRLNCSSYIDAAIKGSDEDIERLTRFLRLRSAEAARGVVAADQQLLGLIGGLTESPASLDEQVRRSVSGDLAAARALTQAARTIELGNIRELSPEAAEE